MVGRHPGDYLPFRPNVQPFIFDLFLDKPALFLTEANEGGLLAGEITAFNPMADQINSLSGGVDWQSLGTILKRLYLEKTDDDGILDVRMYINDLILANESQTGRTYHIARQETLNVPIVSLTVNGQAFPYYVETGSLLLDVQVQRSASIEIIIHYVS
ncbi:MAG TPA: hypothetical protein VJ327_04775 [Patescibacteria group bacterium]|nr:hypothetical protein [Patescibacteria group bacterium]